eukprot:COSAG06_NODE_31029_length_528_cov_0.729604_2_plen_78_part_01
MHLLHGTVHESQSRRITGTRTGSLETRNDIAAAQTEPKAQVRGAVVVDENSRVVCCACQIGHVHGGWRGDRCGQERSP